MPTDNAARGLVPRTTHVLASLFCAAAAVVLVGDTAVSSLPHTVYDLDEIADVAVDPPRHQEESKTRRRFFAVKLVRKGFDMLSGYRGPGCGMAEKDWLHRCLFLETVAGVPGSVTGMTRHLQLLRSMRRD